jgi:hypothetical protein
VTGRRIYRLGMGQRLGSHLVGRIPRTGVSTFEKPALLRD